MLFSMLSVRMHAGVMDVGLEYSKSAGRHHGFASGDAIVEGHEFPIQS
jgi:hypothetical protein